MADDPFMTLPASALRHAAAKQDRDAAERERFERLARLADRPGAVAALVQMWVTCERCGRPVERMGWTGGSKDQDFTVWCHGESETTRIDAGADVVGLTGGVAFRRKLDG